jgi:hypothetical protein
MLFNTSYRNKDYEKVSDDMLGKAFTLLEKLKLRGVGSSRLMIQQLSPNLKPKNMQSIDANYSNIELRPKGIIVHFTNRLDRYSWTIPFYRLTIFSAQMFSIHCNGDFIQFEKNKNYHNNKKFIQKIITHKNASLNLEYYDG